MTNCRTALTNSPIPIGNGLGVRRCLPECDGDLGEIDAADGQSDRRHDDMVNKCTHDCRECRAEDDSHGEIHDVAPSDELLEFVEHDPLLFVRLSCRKPGTASDNQYSHDTVNQKGPPGETDIPAASSLLQLTRY